MRERISNALSFYAALVATNVKSALSLRAAFWISAFGMALNNVIFFSMWWIFFDRFEEIGGWRVNDLCALFGLVAAGFGLCNVFAGGVRELARSIDEGALDAFLTQPKHPLVHLLGSRSVTSGWGDAGSGFGFLALSGHMSFELLPLAVLGTVLSAIVFAACGVLVHSLAFWLGRADPLARQFWDFLVTFSIYPRPLFSGALKLVLFTLIPAGFIGFLPVELVRDFSLQGLASAVAGAVVYAALALLVFERGLRRYASGNRVAVRA